jgi:hypothetical protein
VADDTINTVVTKRDGEIEHSTAANTPGDQPNARLIPMQPFKIVLIRAARTYLNVVIGLLTAAGVGADGGMMPNDFGPLMLSVLQLGLAPAVMSIIMNSSELLTKIDVNFPQLRA